MYTDTHSLAGVSRLAPVAFTRINMHRNVY